jgi:hypothetical protein
VDERLRWRDPFVPGPEPAEPIGGS